MAYKDLQAFIKKLEKEGLLKRVSTQVDSNLEITEIADRMVKSGGPALFFENVKGSEYPVFINGFASYERLNMAFEVDSIDDFADQITDLLDVNSYMGLMDKIKSIPKLTRMLEVFPKTVSSGACQQVVEEPDLDSLPVLQCWPEDGGRFFTLPLVFTRDPDTGQQNIGMYRMQVLSKNTTGMHWHLHKDGRAIYEKYRKRGEKMPVSVAVGCDPSLIYAATAPLPSIIDETMFAGFLRRSSVDLVKCVTNPIKVPANAEFILEGWVDPTEPLVLEGPFGDHTGYYSLQDYYPVFHIDKITRKKKPVYPATIVGKPPMEDCYLAKLTERTFLPLLKMINPEIIDINLPLEGVFHNCVIVSIEKKFPGHAKKVMNALWGTGQMMYTKMIIVVDKNVNVQDLSTVMWKVFNNIDAKRDLLISEGPLDALDHASPLPHYGSRLGIDATKKWPEEGHNREWPNDIEMSDEIKNKVTERWSEYGL
ncbi:MAG: menaquinone biosynthesis decarboxylase [Spirochaetales bacterium]|uniref:Menaquinone biosynthesis decarboxylase n=1 Tax=Candidatus Thalassospirochaeta sargassi TaxID=3119039 RepID=A0AAJ1IC07_9SPIO|nr:menaquinone biosynthesis decarboxylase [Spirochaetales bacterium]